MNKYDDSAKGGYTYEEKLRQVALGNMDPKEIDLTSEEDAQALLGEKEIPRKLGDFVTFEASIVPLDIRAEWAYSENKIIPPSKADWIDEWKKDHEKDIVIQSRMRSGTALATAQRTVTNHIEGFALMMTDSAELLLKEYAREKALEGEFEVVSS